MKVNIQDISINATTFANKGIAQFITAYYPDRNIDFNALTNRDNAIRYVYGDVLWEGSPSGLILSYGSVNNPDTSEAKTIQYVAEMLISFDGKIYARSHNTNWTKWVQLG